MYLIQACLLRANGVELEEKRVTISKGEHLTKEYRALNPLGKVPCYEVTSSSCKLSFLASSCIQS